MIWAACRHWDAESRAGAIAQVSTYRGYNTARSPAESMATRLSRRRHLSLQPPPPHFAGVPLAQSLVGNVAGDKVPV